MNMQLNLLYTTNKMKVKLLNYYYSILWKLAKSYINKHKPETIGITWSVGKTWLRAIIYTVLQKDLKNKIIYSSPKNFNWRFWFSLSILKIEDYTPWVLSLVRIFFVAVYRSLFWWKKYDVIILEYWIDEIWEMDFLLSIVKPNISIFTKIDKVHCKNFGSPDITATEKFKLIENAKDLVVLNYDDSYARSWYSKINVDKFYYSTQPEWKNVDIDFQDASLFENNWIIYSKFNLRIKNKYLFVKSNLLSRESYWYTWVAILILDVLSYKFNNVSFLNDYPWSEIEYKFTLQPWRMTIFQGISNSVLVDSTYNCAPQSLDRMINNVYNFKNNVFPDYKVILFIGDMRELWDFEEQEHRKIAWVISQVADYVYLIWPNSTKYTQDELIKIWFQWDNIKAYLSSIKAWQDLKNLLLSTNSKFVILFKWSQNTIFTEEWLKQVLMSEEDVGKLPRQSTWWLNKKSIFFKNLN